MIKGIEDKIENFNKLKYSRKQVNILKLKNWKNNSADMINFRLETDDK